MLGIPLIGFVLLNRWDSWYHKLKALHCIVKGMAEYLWISAGDVLSVNLEKSYFVLFFFGAKH